MSTTTARKGVTRREARRPRPQQHESGIVAVLYARISLDREQTQLGVDRQLDQTRPHVERMGAQLVGVFVDNSISALTGKLRPEFENMLDAIRAGGVTHLFCWHPDRLTRNQEETAALVALLREHSITVVATVAGSFDMSQATARHLFGMVASNSTFESELKGERMVGKHKQIAESGGTSGGPRPFGYTSSKRSAIVPHEAELLREATRRVIAGEPLNRIATDWNERGETTTNGCKWSATQVYGKLRSPGIAALRELHGETYKGKWEPIISRRDFERVAVILSDPSRKKRSADEPFLLHGIAVGEDGTPLVGKQSGGVRKYYGVGAGMCNESDLDRIVTSLVFDRIEQRGGIALTDVGGAERTHVAARVEQLEAELAQLAALRRDRRLALDEYFVLRAGTSDELDEMYAQLAALTPVETDVADRLFKPGVAKREWPQLDVHERRRIVRRLIEAVVVHKTRRAGVAARLSREFVEWPERVVIKWRR